MSLELTARIPRLLHHVRRGVFLAALLGVGLQLDLDAADPLAPKRLWFAVAAGLVPALGLLGLWWGRPLRLPSKRLLLHLGGWCVLIALAGMLSPFKGLAQNTWQAWCLSAALLLGLADLLAEAEDQAWALKMFMLSALVCGLVGLVAGQTLGGRSAGSLGNPNFAGGYFVLALPLALWMAKSADQKFWRWIGWVAAVVSLASLAMSGSKAAYLGLGVSIAVAGHLVFWSPAPYQTKRKSLLGLSGLWMLGLLAGISLLPSAGRQHLLGGPQAWKPSLTFRQTVWQGSLAAFKARPVFGYGPGTFEGVYPSFRDPQSMQGAVEHAYTVSHAENWAVQTAVETGLLGLAALIALLWALLWPLRKLSVEWVSQPKAALALAILSAVLGSLACNLASLDLFLPSSLLPMLFLLGLGLALNGLPARISINAEGWARLAISAGLALGASVPIVHAQLQWQSSKLLAQAKLLSQAKRYEDAAPKYNLAVDFQPDNLEARYFRACNLQDQGRPQPMQEASEAFRDLSIMAPDYVLLHERLGRLYWDQGRKAEALVQWQRQLQLDPYYLPAVQAVASLLAEQGDMAGAEKILSEALLRWPEQKELADNLALIQRAAKKKARR